MVVDFRQYHHTKLISTHFADSPFARGFSALQAQALTHADSSVPAQGDSSIQQQAQRPETNNVANPQASPTIPGDYGRRQTRKFIYYSNTTMRMFTPMYSYSNTHVNSCRVHAHAAIRHCPSTTTQCAFAHINSHTCIRNPLVVPHRPSCADGTKATTTFASKPNPR